MSDHTTPTKRKVLLYDDTSISPDPKHVKIGDNVVQDDRKEDIEHEVGRFVHDLMKSLFKTIYGEDYNMDEICPNQEHDYYYHNYCELWNGEYVDFENQ
jgi:hypothetical protein